MTTLQRVLVLVTLSGAMGVAVAADRPPGPASPPPTRKVVEQKEAFVQRLLSDPPAAERLSASGNREAQKLMSAAHDENARAAALLRADEIAGADAAFNETMWLIVKARQLVPDSANRAMEQRTRYTQLLASIESLQWSYREHLSHLGRKADPEPGWQAVARLVDEARTRAGNNQMSEANRALLQAEHRLLLALNTVLATRTIDYTPHFSDPADEFRYELERNRSYVDLVPLAVAELRPPEDAMRLIARYLESNRSLRDTAQQQAARREHPAALKSIRAGTTFLERALAAAGLAVPQELKD